MPYIPAYVATVLAVMALGCAAPASDQAETGGGAESAGAATSDAPMVSATFQVDPFWPKALPNNWLLGHVIGIAVDSRDHIWVLHRPRSLSDSERGAELDPPTSECCVAAPAVLEFDQEGNVVQGWGGPADGYDWPNEEHGIFVDHMDNVWIGGNGQGDGQVLKFARDGTFLMQIGSAGPLSGSDDTTRLGRAADIGVDAETNEVFVADGYGNRRVIVFDADTGEYQRHWGAYGTPPVDGDLEPYDQQADPSPIFGDTVHCVQLSNEGLVYVCDRMNHRLQIFQKDGTFVREGFIGRATAGASVWDVAFSPDAEQTYLYNADGGNHLVWTVQHDSLETLGTIGRRGRMAGQFESTHSLAVDSQGNLYVGETLNGRRVQKFMPTNQ